MEHLRQDEKYIRKTVIRTVLWTTLVFFLALWGALTVHARLPGWQAHRAEGLLLEGDTAGARALAVKLRDEALQQELLTRCDYADAAALLEAGDTAAARELYAACGDYEDAPEKVRLCGYKAAEALLADGDYDAAAEAFGALAGYADAADRARDCRYEKAEALLSAGDKAAAGEIFDALGDWRDASDRLGQIAVEFTGIADPEAALNAYRGLTPQAWEHLKALADRRASLPRGIVDVGFFHTVGLAADGTVLACGDDSFGQCDVSGWKDVTAVAAGAYHTAALLSDGTVKAAGRNSEGQCAVEKWRDVVRIACGDYATFGLTSRGELLCAGFNYVGEAADWTGLTDLAGGSYNLAVRVVDGSVWACPRLEGQAKLDGCAALAVSTGYAVGAMEDGSAVSTAFDLSGWEDVVALDAGTTAVLGLELSGRVRGYFFRDRDAVDLSGFENAVALAAGGTHHALVFADGSVAVLGSTDAGQGDVSVWRLAVG